MLTKKRKGGTIFTNAKQITLAMTMLCFLLPFKAHAQIKKDPRSDFITTLTEQNILHFMRETSDIAIGNRPDLLDDDATDFFNNHVSDKAEFKSVMQYQIPGFPTQDIDMKLGKKEYIRTILDGRFMLQDYSTQITISDLKITGNGKKATFTSVTKEKGLMPFPKNEDKPDELDMIPINGESTCQQTMIVSYNNFIQMAAADCNTNISFDPFAGKPLIDR